MPCASAGGPGDARIGQAPAGAVVGTAGTITKHRSATNAVADRVPRRESGRAPGHRGPRGSGPGRAATAGATAAAHRPARRAAAQPLADAAGPPARLSRCPGTGGSRAPCRAQAAHGGTGSPGAGGAGDHLAPAAAGPERMSGHRSHGAAAAGRHAARSGAGGHPGGRPGPALRVDECSALRRHRPAGAMSIAGRCAGGPRADPRRTERHRATGRREGIHRVGAGDTAGAMPSPGRRAATARAGRKGL